MDFLFYKKIFTQTERCKDIWILQITYFIYKEIRIYTNTLELAERYRKRINKYGIFIQKSLDLRTDGDHKIHISNSYGTRQKSL